MTTWVDRDLFETVGKNVYLDFSERDQEFPDDLRRSSDVPVRLVSSLLHQHRPYAVSTVVADGLLGPRSRSWTLFSFGTFRKRITPIERVAEAIAPFYLEFGVLPLIRPMFAYEWDSVRDRSLGEQLRLNGVLLYSTLRS